MFSSASVQAAFCSLKKPHIYLTEMLSKLIHVPVKHKTSQAGAGTGKKEANGLFTAQGTS